MPEPSINWKEIIKAFLLTLLLIPVVYFCCGMLSSAVTSLIFLGKGNHDPKDVNSEVVFVAMMISLIACLGFTAAIIPLAYIPLNVMPRWVMIVLGIVMIGCAFYGIRMYHEPG